ncbi:chemotaxis protein CheB, partial [Acaryochloris marina NIES-2412]|uniref:chemotaxis protein CheB n=1 Tax=Acaryochloris marina TaxID=155978 RepID=UPI004058F051
MNGNQAGQPSHSPSAELVLVVGIGASAGGLEAISELLRHLPTDSGMAYVLIQHLSADQPSLMSEILSRTTLILVTEVEDGVAIEPNHIYSIPSNTQMTIEAGHLRLMSRDRTQPKFMPIDT